MKNRTENAPGKTGGAGGPAEPGYENPMDDAIRLAGTNPRPDAPTPPLRKPDEGKIPLTTLFPWAQAPATPEEA